ncbi:MAG: flavodoxin family protein [Peptococcaceae bacterium]
MRVIAINGSHRKGKNTAIMLQWVLDEIATANIETELIELTDYKVTPCKACNFCLRETDCKIKNDDMMVIAEKMFKADGIVLGSPVYFTNVTGLMKVFIDRTRWMHMCRNMLSDKIGAVVTNAGLRNGGQEIVLNILTRFLMAHGLHIVDSRNPEEGIYNIGATGTVFQGLSQENHVINWKKSIREDDLAFKECKELGRNLTREITFRKINSNS